MNKLITIIFLLFALTGWTQTVHVMDKVTLQGVEDVQIFNDSFPDTKVFTDAKGWADISSINKKGSIIIRHVYYAAQALTYKEIRKKKFKIHLAEKITEYDGVIFSARRSAEKKADVVQKIQVIRSSDLQVMNQTSAADMLSQTGNILVQKSQQGGGSPIIRGFETNRVLIVVDGVRMNNAIYRGGHLQNVMTVDNSVMEKVEVAFGPSSAAYGSDALGGVMHFFTKNPSLSSADEPLVKAGAYGRYFSAANGYAVHGDMSVANRRFGSLTSFTVSKFNDLKQGSNRSSKYPDFGKRLWYQDRIDGVDTVLTNSDENLQTGSSYEQLDILQKFLWLTNEKVKQTLNFQYSTTNLVARYDRLTQMSGSLPKYAEWNYGPQRRLFLSYMLELSNKNKLYDLSTIVVGYQQIQESRITRRFGNANRDEQVEDLDILSVNADFDKKIGKNTEFHYGLEGYTNQVQSTATRLNIETDELSQSDTRYPDGGSGMNGVAAYATAKTHFGKEKKRWILSEGIRFSHIQLNAKFIDKTFFPFPFSEISQKNSTVTGNIGVVYNGKKDWRFTASASTGFRAPNVDDLSKVFESIPGTVIVPNPDLKPEYSYNGEVGLSKTIKKKITISALGYYTLLSNVINVQGTTFEGKDSINFNGTLSQVRTSVNSASAFVTGFEGGIRGELANNLAFFGTINYTYGRINTDSTTYPLDHIAPLFGRAGLTYTRTKFRGEVFSNFSGAKLLKDYNLVGEDNFANATVDGMPAWYTLNLRVNYQFLPELGMQVAVENILDRNYRVFASNISAPGRNVIATLRYNF